MRFLITMGDGGGAWGRLSPAQQAEVMAKHAEFQRALEAAGKYVLSHQLHPASEAKTVRRDEHGRFRITDGPFAESKELSGGFYLIEADSLDEALDWARKGRFIAGSNEVRAVWET